MPARAAALPLSLITIVVQLESSRERAAAVALRGDQDAPRVSLCCSECGTKRGPMPLSVRRTALLFGWLSGADDGGGLLETDASEKTVERFRCCGGEIGDCRKTEDDSEGAATWRHRVGDPVVALAKSGATDDDAAEADDAVDGGGRGACIGGAEDAGKRVT